MKLTVARPTSMPIAVDQPSDTTALISTLLPGAAIQNLPELRRDALIAPDHLPLRPTQRLVVLVPEDGLDEGALARRVWQLACGAALNVLFLGRSPDPESVAPTRRQLALLAAAVRQGDVSARASVVVGVSWLQAVEDVLQNGDLLVCIAGHRVSYLVVGRRRLGDVLARTFKTPVYLLGGLHLSRSPVLVQRARALVAWSISIAILVGFAGLQIWLSRNVSARFSPVLLGLSIIVEGLTLLKTIEWIG